MKEYLMLFRGGDAKGMEPSSKEWQAHMQKWMQWMGEMTEKGNLIGAQPLNESGRKITGSKRVVTDGPFMEGKEMVGGYLVCKAGTYDEAVEIASECPILDFDDGIVEVREIREMKM